MKPRTKIALWCCGILAALAAVPAWKVASFIYRVKSFDADAERAKPPLYTANASFSGFEVAFELYPRHPFLAEYTIVITGSRDGRVLSKEEFIDTGGLSTFYCLSVPDAIVISNWNKDGILIDTQKRRISAMDGDKLPPDYESRAFGRFCFGGNTDRRYLYKEIKTY